MEGASTTATRFECLRLCFDVQRTPVVLLHDVGCATPGPCQTATQ